MTGPHFGMIPRWLAPLGLTGREFRVLLVIASHAGKASREPRPDGVIEARIARIGTERIADEANLDRRNVQRAIGQLEAKGILERLHGGGRGRLSEYQVIFKRAADATNSVDDDAVSDADDTGNSVVFGQETASFSDLNSVTDDAVSEPGDTGNSVVFGQETASFSDVNSVTDDAPTESKQKERTDPPSGESRARGEEDFSNDWVNEKQGVLLTPINGGGDRMTPLRRYNPSAELLDWARESYSINALDERVLGEFIDWHIEHDNVPGNLGAIEAAYRRWIRREPHFAGQSRHRPQQHSNAAEAEAEAAVEAVRRMRAMRANGAGND